MKSCTGTLLQIYYSGFRWKIQRWLRMSDKNTQSKGSFAVTGTPFDPYENRSRDGAQMRIMPTQFIHPMSPVKYSLFRNIVPGDMEPTDKYYYWLQRLIISDKTGWRWTASRKGRFSLTEHRCRLWWEWKDNPVRQSVLYTDWVQLRAAIVFCCCWHLRHAGLGSEKSEPREWNSNSQSERSVYAAIARRDTGGTPVRVK